MTKNPIEQKKWECDVENLEGSSQAPFFFHIQLGVFSEAILETSASNQKEKWTGFLPLRTCKAAIFPGWGGKNCIKCPEPEESNQNSPQPVRDGLMMQVL